MSYQGSVSNDSVCLTKLYSELWSKYETYLVSVTLDMFTISKHMDFSPHLVLGTNKISCCGF